MVEPDRTARSPAAERDALGGEIVPGAVGPAIAPATATAARPVPLLAGALALALFTALGQEAGRMQHLLPGAVAGFALLTAALALTERRATAVAVAVRRGLAPIARVLLGEMGLLFVPAAVLGAGRLSDLPARPLLACGVALVASTLLGLVVTALIADGSWPRRAGAGR